MEFTVIDCKSISPMHILLREYYPEDLYGQPVCRFY
jgi:hypothetical protein